MFDDLFSPASIAIIGASMDENKIGNVILRNLISSGFSGRVYPVNPSYSEIMDLKCYPSVKDIGDPTSIAVIVLPAHVVPQTVEDCISAGVKFLIIISGGFAETGLEGKKLSDRILSLIRNSGTRLIGPNTVGLYLPYSNINTTLTSYSRVSFPPPGNIGFISQSGALGLLTMDAISEYGIGISAFINLGNRLDVDETEFLDFFESDSRTGSVAIYMESVADGRSFYERIRRFNSRKPLVILKAGRTEQSAMAASLHTGAMASNDSIFNGMLSQAGSVRAYDETELIDYARVLAYSKQMTGNRIAVLTTAGGVGVISTDYISDSRSIKPLQMARLSENTKDQIRKVIVPYGSAQNPIDLTADGSVNDYDRVLEILMRDDDVDAVLVYALPQTPKMDIGVVDVVEKHVKAGKPIVVGVLGYKIAKQLLVEFERRKIPAYPSVHRSVKSLGALYEYSAFRSVRQ
ncbi:MAG: CoA-binding protein [Candidatus Thermoplasmatota archaeon]|nr:CoA-binding protein [Candidatus Thermoplasmatota archaeon]